MHHSRRWVEPDPGGVRFMELYASFIGHIEHAYILMVGGSYPLPTTAPEVRTSPHRITCWGVIPDGTGIRGAGSRGKPINCFLYLGLIPPCRSPHVKRTFAASNTHNDPMVNCWRQIEHARADPETLRPANQPSAPPRPSDVIS